MKLPILDQHGKASGSVDLAIEKVDVTMGLLHQAVLRAQNNARHPIARTKTRDERRGGGKKPWKQKGTGRARQGSIRSPQWKKGGVVHGPTGSENYVTKMPKSARRAAIRQALRVVIETERLHPVAALALSAPKTKELATTLALLPAKGMRRVLILTPGLDATLERAARNIPTVKIIDVARLNVPDLLGSDCILAVGTALETVQQALTPSEA